MGNFIKVNLHVIVYSNRMWCLVQSTRYLVLFTFTGIILYPCRIVSRNDVIARIKLILLYPAVSWEQDWGRPLFRVGYKRRYAMARAPHLKHLRIFIEFVHTLQVGTVA